MSFKQGNAAISQLERIFAADKKALKLLRELRTLLDNSSFPKEAKVNFPLPKECLNKGTFALFSDGACKYNPGPGAYGVMAQEGGSGKVLFELWGTDFQTTNNRMELEGAIAVLEELIKYLDIPLNKKINFPVFLYTDSSYLVNGINKWLSSWKKNNWITKSKKTPLNLDLWKQLDFLKERFLNLKFLWIKGHAGHPQNENCDKLANDALK